MILICNNKVKYLKKMVLEVIAKLNFKVLALIQHYNFMILNYDFQISLFQQHQFKQLRVYDELD